MVLHTSFSESLMIEGQRFPLVLRPTEEATDLADLVRRHRDSLASRLLDHGALLFRGFALHDIEAFDRVVDALSERRLEYVNRSTPRTSLGRGIYTATEYPPNREIPLHNENAYHTTWPLKLVFACMTPAAEGGETPLADMRRVTAGIDASILDSFERRKVRYVRHYHPNCDLPWQEVFQLQDRGALAEYCSSNGIDHEWITDAILRTSQVCQGTALHPVTGERVPFNQAHLFHVSSLGSEMAKMMADAFGTDRLPRHATYGDGEEIEPESLQAVREAFDNATVAFPWERGDVLVVDNMQVAHGRRRFKGERKIVAALLDPYPN